MNKDKINYYRTLVNNFLHLDYFTVSGKKTAFGILTEVLDDSIVLKSLGNDSHWMIKIDSITSCKASKYIERGGYHE